MLHQRTDPEKTQSDGTKDLHQWAVGRDHLWIITKEAHLNKVRTEAKAYLSPPLSSTSSTLFPYSNRYVGLEPLCAFLGEWLSTSSWLLITLVWESLIILEIDENLVIWVNMLYFLEDQKELENFCSDSWKLGTFRCRKGQWIQSPLAPN